MPASYDFADNSQLTDTTETVAVKGCSRRAIFCECDCIFLMGCVDVNDTVHMV